MGSAIFLLPLLTSVINSYKKFTQLRKDVYLESGFIRKTSMRSKFYVNLCRVQKPRASINKEVSRLHHAFASTQKLLTAIASQILHSESLKKREMHEHNALIKCKWCSNGWSKTTSSKSCADWEIHLNQINYFPVSANLCSTGNCDFVLLGKDVIT